jgi:hypothetical protein
MNVISEKGISCTLLKMSFCFEASLEAANNHATHLHHRLAQMSAEASRLHQLLYHNQQCLEGLQQEKQAFICKLEAAQVAAEEEHKKHVIVRIPFTRIQAKSSGLYGVNILFSLIIHSKIFSCVLLSWLAPS